MVDFCSICLEEYGFQKYLYKTICNHIYHKECIERWLYTNNTCPYCRTFINPKKFIIISSNTKFYYFYETNSREILVKTIENEDIELIKKHISKTYSIKDILYIYYMKEYDLVDTIIHLNSDQLTKDDPMILQLTCDC